MSFLLPLFAGLGTMALGKLTEPKAPKATPFTPVDLQKETTDIFNQNEAMKPAENRQATAAAWTSALALSRGQLPEDVQKMVRQSAAESAANIGLSGDQATRLTARNLGLTSLDAMAQGQKMAAQLETMRDNDWAVAQNSALSKANQLFESWSVAEQNKMNRYAMKLQSHQQFFSGLTTLATSAATAYAQSDFLTKQQDKYLASTAAAAAEDRQFRLQRQADEHQFQLARDIQNRIPGSGAMVPSGNPYPWMAPTTPSFRAPLSSTSSW